MNIFGAITSGLKAYNAISGTQMGQDAVGKVKQSIEPIAKSFTPAIQTAKSSFSPITNAVSSIGNTIVKDVALQNKRESYYKPFKSEIEKIGLTYDDLAELPEEEKQKVVSQLKQIGVEVPGYEESVQQTQPQENLGFLGSLKEGAIGASRVGQYLPEIAGNIGGMVPGLLGEGAGLIGGAFGVEKQDNPIYRNLKAGQKATENIGKSIVAPGEVGLTEGQKSARRAGATTALTLPVGGGYLAGAKGMTGLQGAKLLSTQGVKNLSQGLIGRSAVVGAGFGASQPILEKGSDATMGDIASGAGQGALVGAVASPVISKTLKYGKAGYYGGLEGAGKSISRDIKGGVQAITPSGANISTRANRFNANEIRDFKKMTGESPGEFATSRGMTKTGDDAVVEATNRWQASKDQADEALQAIKGRFRFTDEGEDLLKTTIDDLETRLVNTKSPDSKRISQLKAKYEDSGLTMSEINEIKRAYSNNYKYSFVDAGSESALRSKNLQDAVRKWQFKVAEENGLTNLKDINKTTQGWKMFADSLSKKIQGSSGNNAVSLTDWIALSGGSPENIALYLGKKLASSDTIKRGAIKLFSKQTKPSIIQASKADIQQSNFQKNVNRGVSGVGDNSGGKSLVRPVGLLQSPSGKATGAKNIRVNQPMEKTQLKNETQVGTRPGTSKKSIPEPKKLLEAPKIPEGTTLPRNDIIAESMRNTNSKRPEYDSKQKMSKPSTGITVPDGYFKNAFGEIQKLPSNKKGGFIRIGSENPFAKNPYISGDFSPIKDLDSDALYRAIGTKDWDNIPKKVTLYRGIKSDKDFELFSGDFLTKNRKIAENFAGKNGRVKAFKVDTDDLYGSDFGYEEVIYKPSKNK